MNYKICLILLILPAYLSNNLLGSESSESPKGTVVPPNTPTSEDQQKSWTSDLDEWNKTLVKVVAKSQRKSKTDGTDVQEPTSPSEIKIEEEKKEKKS